MRAQNRDFDYETKSGGLSQAAVKENDYPEKGIRYYQALVNRKSLGGLPGLLCSRVQDPLDVVCQGEAKGHHLTLDTFQGKEGAGRGRVQVRMRTSRRQQRRPNRIT